MNATNAVRWLAMLLSILLQVVTSLAVRGYYPDGGRFSAFSKCQGRRSLKQLDYELDISMSESDSWLGLHPPQLTRDRNLELII